MPKAKQGEALLKVLYCGITWLFNSEFYPYPSAVRAIKEAAVWKS